jgi:pimeloyl-ACP methyl ester carboxylesterase
MKQLMFPEDIQFWFETLRAFGLSAYGGSDFGEVVATVSRITSGDYDSWYDEWLATAERLAAEAAGAHEVTARETLLRASTYYRTAEFFLHGNPDDPRIAYAYDRNVECFLAARVAEPVEIPYEGTVLRGYFYRAPGSGQLPTVVMTNGFDGTAEELQYFGAGSGSERGYHVLTFDGPGQGSAIHREGLVFRPDWENVISSVIDFLTADSGVDSKRIALVGWSFGGVLAPRAAAFEPRISALVAVDGVYDAAIAPLSKLPFERDEIERRVRAERDDPFDALLAEARKASPTLRWLFGHGQYVMGAASDREFLAKYLDYHLRDGVAERIACPVLVCEATDDLFLPGGAETEPEPRRLYKHLTAPKTLLTFTEEEGADAHCHVGAQHLAVGRIYDWLDDVL